MDQTGNSGRSVAIIGGGIAGLAAALCFARTGADVQVFEKAPELKEVGAGLQITPNGGAVLAALGLAEQADYRSIRAAAVRPVDALTGRAVTSFDLTRLAGQPYRFFHRADLLDLLATACEARGVRITTAARAASVSGNTATFEDGQTVTADLLVGADGLHSIVRQTVNGADKPFFTGQVAWRTVVKIKDAVPVARIWMGPGKHVVTYPLIGGRLNIVAVQERQDWVAEGWNYFDAPENLQAAFADCAPELQEILAQAQAVRLWGLFRHPVAEKWHDGAMAILGDAAHPTLPFLAQGANLALEDAWVLAAACAAHRDLPTALAAYQQRRRDRAARAIAGANANARNYHLTGLRKTVAHLGLATLGKIAPNAFLGRMDWLYGHDVTAYQFDAA